MFIMMSLLIMMLTTIMALMIIRFVVHIGLKPFQCQCCHVKPMEGIVKLLAKQMKFDSFACLALILIKRQNICYAKAPRSTDRVASNELWPFGATTTAFCRAGPSSILGWRPS